MLDVWKQRWNAEPESLLCHWAVMFLQLPLMWQHLLSWSQGLSQAFLWPKTFRSGFYCQFISLLWPKHITVLLCPGYGTPQTSAFCKAWLHLASAAHDGFNLQYFSKPCETRTEKFNPSGFEASRQKKKIKYDTWNPGVQLCVGPHAGFGAVSVLWQQNSTNRTERKAASDWYLGNLAYFAVWKLVVLTIIRKKSIPWSLSKAKWGKGRWHLELQTFPQLLSLCFWSQAAVRTPWWFVIKPKAWRFRGVLVAYQVKLNLVSIMEYFSSVTPWGSLGTDRPFILNRWPRLKKTLFVC